MPRTLLIVDDNDVNRRILCKMLGGEYDVLQAADGREAMAALQRSHEIISAVLLDIVMPEMDGYEVLEAMSGDERLRSIPVIVTTGNTETGSEIKALTLGANDFVSKPYNVEIIRRRLRNTIRLRETAAMVNALRVDRLTGLLTRGAFLDKAAELIAARQPGYYMMAAFDIDNFKVINDQYGTAKGDDVLRAVARLLSGVFETVGGLCCRVTADSFAVLYPRSFSGTARSQELQAALGALDGSLQPITFRIGVYAVDDPSLPASAMYDRAAMAEASIKGRYDTRVAFYDEAMRASILREQKIVNEMDSALSEGRFELWLQPQYNHATGALIGSEALVRWRQLDGGLVPPGDFIPVFERNGFIYEMDKYVWEQACALLRRWLDGGVPVLPISINISRHDVFRADFYETLTGLVAKYGIPVDLLRLEITESAFVKSSGQIVAMVERLMAFGFTIEIDDFGSGYSSLNTLKDVPATVLKLDMKFLEGSGHSQRGGNILESIVRMAKWLGMSVIAEGVETREQADFLKSIGCCYVQGYYYARPMPVSDYEALAVSRRGEARMSALETVESLDNDAFWDPHSMDTLIFNSYVGGACIVEYTNRRMEILRANDKFLREFAPDGSTLSSLHLRSRLNEQDFIALYACFDRAVSTGEEAACEVSVAPPAEGEAQFIRAAVRLIARAGERLLLYCGVTNVTALRAAERRGRDSEDRLSAIIEGINGGVTATVMLGEQPSFLFANQRYFEQLGYTRAQYHAEVASAFELVHPDDRERIEGEVRQASRLRRPFTATYRVTRRDGGVRWMQSSVSLVDFEGVPAPVQLCVQNDVTAERQAYAELEARDEQLRLLSDAAHDLLAQVDESRGVERVLQTLLTYFGGDRAYLFELEEEGQRCANTYEVCAPGVPPEQSRLQTVPFSAFWQRAFERRRCVSIREVDKLEGERAEEKELLAAQGIRSLIAVPLRRDERLTGFIGVDNPSQRQDRAEQLEAIGDYLSSTLWRRDLVRRIESDKETFRLMDEQRHQLLEKLPSGVGIYYVYDDGRIECAYLNDGYYALLGATREKRSRFAAFAALEAVEPDDRQALRDEALAAIRENRQLNLDIRVLSEGGGWRWMNVRANVAEREEGRCKLYCAYSDIDALKLARLQLEAESKKSRESELLIDNILRNLPGAVASFRITEDDVRMTYLSEGCETLTGFSAAETLKRCEGDAFAFVHPDDLPELRRAAQENARLMKPFSHVFRVRVKGGGSRWVSLSLSPARKDGALVYYGVYLDVDAEREHSVMISELINAIPGGVAIYRVGERIETLYASDGVAKLTGRTPEEHARWLKDDPLSGAVYETDLPRVRQSIDDALAQDRPLTLTCRLCHKDGSLVWVQFSAVKIRETSRGKIFYGVYSRPSTEASLYQSLVEDSTTAVLVMEQETRAVLFANAAWKRLENVPDSTPVIGVPLPRLLPAHHFFFSDDEVRAFPTDRYEECRRMTGTGKAVSIHARALRWNGIAAYVCYISDETELWNSHQQLQHLIDRVPGGIGIYDVQDGMPRPSYINDAYYRLLGYADGERALHPEAGTLDVVHEEDRARLLRGVRALTDGSTALLDLSYRVRVRAGEWRWLRVVGAVIERRGDRVVVYCSFSEFDSVMRSRQELESSRAMLNAALQSARVLAWKYDCRSRRITDSGSLGEALGLTRAVDDAPECLIRSGYICEESAADFRALFEEVALQKPASRDVRTRPRPGGEPAWNRVIYTPVFNRKGEYVESIGTSIDITEQKERERKYEEQLGMKKVLASNESAVALLNLTRNLVADSDCRDPRMAACLRGDSVDQALAAVSGQVVYPGERAAYLAVFSRARMLENYRRGDMHGGIRHHALDSGAWLESSYDLIENPYTGDVEAIAVLRDVTELVRAEQVVSTLMKIDYETIMTIDASTGEASPFLGGRTDEAMRRQQAAGGKQLGVEAYLRAHGSGPELERALRETSLPYVKERLARAPLYAAACTLTQEGKPLRKRIVYTYLDETEKTLLCAAQDLTETYRQEEEQKRQLAQALAEAEKASSAKTDFFSRMSHDMRTPMNGILGLAELCENEADPGELRRSMGKIRQSGQYLLSLINDTLDFQRIESGRMKLEPQVVNARTLMADIRDMVELTLREKRLHVSIDSQNADMDCFIRVDPVRIKQVFFNLLSNAIKFTPEDGSIAFSLECLGHDGPIAHDRIRISDTGIGMSEDFLQNHIFRPFSQEYTAVTTQYAGTGLGLSIVHKLVELMGGSISVESAPGRGTAFTILLDFERVPDEEALAGAHTDEQRRHLSREALMGKRVLLVEDHPLNAEIARRLLQKAGCEIDWAHNGQEGVQRFEASPPGAYDAALMDIRMPVMNGLEAARAIRALTRPDARSLPIIAMTANAYAADVKQSLDAGMNAHLAKPIDPALLYDTLARLIAHPPAQ